MNKINLLKEKSERQRKKDGFNSKHGWKVKVYPGKNEKKHISQ